MNKGRLIAGPPTRVLLSEPNVDIGAPWRLRFSARQSKRHIVRDGLLLCSGGKAVVTGSASPRTATCGHCRAEWNRQS